MHVLFRNRQTRSKTQTFVPRQKTRSVDKQYTHYINQKNGNNFRTTLQNATRKRKQFPKRATFLSSPRNAGSDRMRIGKKVALTGQPGTISFGNAITSLKVSTLVMVWFVHLHTPRGRRDFDGNKHLLPSTRRILCGPFRWSTS